MRYLIAAFLLQAAVPAAPVHATPPTHMAYQGRLQENGKPVNGNKSVVFKIYDAEILGTLLFTAPAQAVIVRDGAFTASIDLASIPFSTSGQLYLEVVVEGTTLSPRDPFRSVPSALTARSVSGPFKKFPETGDVDVAGSKVINLGTPTLGSDAVTKSYVDLVVSGSSANADAAMLSSSQTFTGQNIFSNQVTMSNNALVGGRLGIGTASPVSPLNIVGANNPHIEMNSTDGSGYALHMSQSGTLKLSLAVNSADSYLDAVGGNILHLDASGVSNQIVLMPSGKVGIGTNAPGQKLSVVGTIESTSGGFKFPDGTTQTTAIISTSSYASLAANQAFTGINTFSTTTVHNGKVGIGVSNPTQSLEIAGPASIFISGGFPAPQYSSINFGLFTNRWGLRFITPVSTYEYLDLLIDTNGQLGPAHSRGLRVIDVNTGANHFYVSETGRVGIGTSAPGQRLTVAGTVESSSGGFKFPDGTTQTTAIVSTSSYASLATTQTFTGAITFSTTTVINGRVGINKSNPSTALEIASPNTIWMNGGLAVGEFDALNFGTSVNRWGLRHIVPQSNYEYLDVLWDTTGQLGPDHSRGVRYIDSKTGLVHMYLSETGRLGVGTSTPTSKVTVFGVIESTGGFKFPDGTLQITANVSTASYAALNSTQTFTGTNTFSTTTVHNGRVGIFKTSPSTALEIASPNTIWMNGGLAVGEFDALNFGTSVNRWGLRHIVPQSNYEYLDVLWDTTGQLGPDHSRGVRFIDSKTGLVHMYLSETGRLGVGTSTPTQKMTVFGVIESTGGFKFPDGTIQMGAVVSTSSFAVLSATQTYTAQRTFSNQVTVSSHVLISGTGRLGIGTTTPVSPLNIVGTNSPHIEMNSSDGSGYALHMSMSGTQKLSLAVNSGDSYLDSVGGNLLHLDASGLINQMTLLTNGNVGIGNTTPTSKLTVFGVIESTGGYKFPDATTQTTAAGGLVSTQTFTGQNTFSNQVTVSSNVVVSNPNGRIGVGTTAPRSAIQMDTGDLYVSVSTNGVIMKAPNATCYRLTVSNTPALVITSVTCP